MRCSQLAFFALPLVSLAQAAAVRRDGGGYEEKHPDDGKSQCHPEKIYVTLPPEKHYVTHYATKTEHKVEYHTVEGPTKHVTETVHKEGPTKHVTETVHKEGPTKTEHVVKTEHVTKTEHKEGPTSYVTKTVEGEKVYVHVTQPAKTVYVTQPANVEYEYKTVTVAPTPKCTVTAKPSVWPQPVDCHDGKDKYGDKCDEKAPAPTTYAHWDYTEKHCYTTWDNKWEPTKTEEHKPKETPKDEHKPKEAPKDDGKDHGKDDGKDDDSYTKGH